MFRYGGPIKEGIMSGIREPHAGGRIGFKDGTKKKTYEFSETPAAKATSGFVHYGPYAGIAGAYDLAAVPINTLSRMFGYNPGFSGTKFMDTLTGGEFSKRTGYDRDKAWFGVPTSAKKGWTIPSMKEGPTASEIELAKLKKQLAEQEKGTMSENLVPEVPKKSDAEKRAERIQKYRDIMDIKGMNKEAAYDSLIAASKAVGESGDFKGDIKSGKLINDIIQSTSKQFDKPSDMKKAIDTLILKGEIQKDIAGAKPSQYEIKEDYLTGSLGAVTGKRVSLGKPGTLSDALLLTKGTDTKTNRTSQALRAYFDGYLTPKFEGKLSSDNIDALGGKEKLIEGESISLDDGVYQISKGYILVEGNKIIKQEDLFTGKD